MKTSPIKPGSPRHWAAWLSDQLETAVLEGRCLGDPEDRAAVAKVLGDLIPRRVREVESQRVRYEARERAVRAEREAIASTRAEVRSARRR